MKKIIIIILLIALPLLANAQMNGSGTLSDPYYGTITSNVTWDLSTFPGGVIYIGKTGTPASTFNDITINTGGHLMISEGITVRFLTDASDLIITGEGQITATGTSSNPIRFTKGTEIDHWGHISFETPGTGTPIAGTGSFNNCIIEYGYAITSGTLPSNAGGGMQVNANGVTITNCLFENNYSNFGGGVTVNAGRNTVIRNTIFRSNTANQAGGALLLWTNSTAIIENCIFERNHSRGISSASYSGGAIWLLSNTSKIVNCTFVENTSDRAGDAIYSYSSSGTRIINSILWGSNNQFAGAIVAATFTNCAFETSKPSQAANSIIISSIADDHFTDAGSGDWSLKYISPCRDAGVDSYPGVTIPPLDYAGNPRVSTTDIGAYEVQYVVQSIWKITAGSTDWTSDSNWDGGVPTSLSPLIVIPSGATNYPTATPAPDFTIGTSNQMILNPGARVTLGALINNGSLLLESDGIGISSLIVNSYSGNDATIELFLTGGGNVDDDNFKWHYISSPVSSLPVNVFAPAITMDLAQWIENRPVLSLLQGWVAYDGYVYSTGNTNGPTFSNLNPGKGYNFFDNADNTVTFSGQLNTGDVQAGLGFSGDSYLHGWNLLGNPFSSGLDWNYIISDASFPANTSKGLYFTRDNQYCSYIAGVGIPGDVNGIIPPMQGFFNKTYSTGNTINLTTTARVQDNIHPRYKGITEIPLIRLTVTENSVTDETVIRFDQNAKNDFDYDFDLVKMITSTNRPLIYSQIGNIKYVINGQPFPAEDEEYEIPLAVNLVAGGSHSIKASQVAGLDNYNVSLTDKETSVTVNLKLTSTLSFTASAGTVTDRFVIKVSKISTGIEDPRITPSNFNIYQTGNLINIQPLADEWNGKNGTVRVFDLTGRPFTGLQNAEFRTNTLLQIRAPHVKGLYMVEIKSGTLRYVGKVMVR